jgi:hypothetical protein
VATLKTGAPSLIGTASLVTAVLNCSTALIGGSAALRIAVLSTLALSVRVEEREGGRRFGFYEPNRALPHERKRAPDKERSNNEHLRNRCDVRSHEQLFWIRQNPLFRQR